MEKIEIIPAILESNFSAVSSRLAQVAGLVRTVQFDICDGTFVSSVTWPFMSPVLADKSADYDKNFWAMIKQESEMPFWEEIDFELDLMVSNPKKLILELMNIGPSRVVFHYESFSDVEGEIRELRKIVPSIVEIGVAFSPTTDISDLHPLITDKIISFVQCMGIEKIGFQGSGADKNFFDKVVKKINELHEKYPDLPVSIDGGVSLSNASELVSAGATRLISGSGIFGAQDVEKRIVEFKSVV